MESGDKKLSRRKFLRLSLAAGASGVMLMTVRKENGDPERVAKIREKDAQPKIATFLEATKNPIPYDTTALQRHSFGGNLPLMTGIYGKAGGATAIDFRYQLAQMLQRKLKLMEGDEPPEEFDDHHLGYLEALEQVYVSYKGTDTMIFEQYRDHIGTLLKDMRREVSMDAVSRGFKLGKHQSKLLKTLDKQIDADLMTAYSMTELMPTENGPTNALVMDFLLQNAGRDYVERIPALGDRELSFGPYQFTKKALQNTLNDHGALERNGASIIDATQKHQILPPDVASMRGDDHYRAAYMFAVYNIVLLVKDLGEVRAQKALNHVSKIETAIPDYIPAAHNSPREARTELVRFIMETTGEKIIMRGNAPAYGPVLREGLQKYVRKTQNNLAAIRSRKKHG